MTGENKKKTLLCNPFKFYGVFLCLFLLIYSIPHGKFLLEKTGGTHQMSGGKTFIYHGKSVLSGRHLLPVLLDVYREKAIIVPGKRHHMKRKVYVTSTATFVTGRAT